VDEFTMSVTRVEGSRPLEATSVTATTQHPRTTGERVSKKEQEAPRAAPPREEEPKITPAESFKPYSLSFRFEKELNRVVVKVIDPETGEAIREIPPESVIEALKQLKKTPGTLVDEEV
jgi:uncharacterized FlaG/YvyC family protein